MNDILTLLGKHGLIPVIKIDSVDYALPLAKALCAGGLPVAEITFRTNCAKEAIEIITKEIPNMLVGAGTILTCDQAQAAISAGAKFIVSPGINPKVVKYCIDEGIAVTPGCSSPTDIETALDLGLDAVKFFPAEAAGGLDMIKALAAPYGNLKFIPTGGINETNLTAYLKFDKILACGGSFMIKDEYIKTGEFDKITALTKNALSVMFGFELKHLGINSPDEGECRKYADLITAMFNFQQKESKGGIMCGDYFEFMKSPYLGTYGHIGIGTNTIYRAVPYFERMGIKFNPDAIKYDDKGNMTAAYFKDEFFGFAVHLVQKNN